MGTAAGTLQCWGLVPAADTRVYAAPTGEPARASTSAGIRVLQPPRPAAGQSSAAAAVPSSEVYYANCDAARRAGAAPIRAGEPGYRRALDRDGDRVACE